MADDLAAYAEARAQYMDACNRLAGLQDACAALMGKSREFDPASSEAQSLVAMCDERIAQGREARSRAMALREAARLCLGGDDSDLPPLPNWPGTPPPDSLPGSQQWTSPHEAFWKSTRKWV